MVECTTSVLPSEYIPGKQLMKIQETGQDLGPQHLPETHSKTSTFITSSKISEIIFTPTNFRFTCVS